MKSQPKRAAAFAGTARAGAGGDTSGVAFNARSVQELLKNFWRKKGLNHLLGRLLSATEGRNRADLSLWFQHKDQHCFRGHLPG